MTNSNARTTLKAALLSAGLFLAPLGPAAAQQGAPVKHHSIMKGAAAGAVAGHMSHRRHGAVMGAVIGAEVQHHRNKVARKRAAR